MLRDDFKQLEHQIYLRIYDSPLYPVRTGNMRRGLRIQEGPNWFKIYVDAYDTKGRYYPLMLERGTGPHNIRGAFGRHDQWMPFKYRGDYTLYPFGIGGRFNNKFHPGSIKRKGFWTSLCAMATAEAERFFASRATRSDEKQ